MGNASTISVKSGQPHLPAAKLHARPARSVRLMQDVVRPAKQAKQSVTQTVSPAAKPQKPQHNVPVALNDIKHRKPQTAQTLMRHSVRKPAPSLKRQLTVSVPTHPNSLGVSVTPKRSVKQIDPRRANLSKSIPKSDFIKRFATEKRSWFSGHEAAAVKVSNPATGAATISPQNRSMDIFQKAIDRATSHQQQPVNPKQQARAAKQLARAHKPVHHRLSTVLAASLAVLLIAGFVAYSQRAAITLRFANAKAGFQAQLPNWTPSGFGVSKFTYAPGSVAVDYSRSGTSRHYTFSQSTSKFNSDDVLKTITPHNTTYQTLQNGGRTIYIFGNNNAAWVDRGKLYKITSDGNLSTSDILAIATSV